MSSKACCYNFLSFLFEFGFLKINFLLIRARLRILHYVLG